MNTHLKLDARDARREGWQNALLALSGGLMLGGAFPPSPFTTLAYVAFVPLFLLFDRIRKAGTLVRWNYLALLVFHLSTLYWTGGFTHMRDPWMMAAGGALLLIHPLFFLPVVLAAHVVRCRLGLLSGLVAFVVSWIAFEYLHSLGELAFPWIAIGNSQALDLARSQIVEYTSVLGLSALTLTFNALAFLLMIRLAAREWRLRAPKAIIAAVLLVAVYVLPLVYGEFRLRQVEREQGPVLHVGLVQPNIDPWEKWGEQFGTKWTGYLEQLDLHLRKTSELSGRRPDLVLWCETAVPFHLLHPRYAPSLERLQHSVATSGVPVFTGLPTAEYFRAADAPVTATRIEASDSYVQSYNSATLFSPDGTIGPVYRKMILVPFGERIPYANALRFLIEPLRWNVGISSWGMGRDTVVYRFRTQAGDSARFSGMICYESVFPNFVRQFTLRGAEFLVVITNDSWWGNTSGVYQHAAYASLRAIENRRWVVQSANGGISLIVRPSGRIESATHMYTATELFGRIERRSDLTPYVRWGDWLGVSALAGAIGLLAFAIIRPRTLASE